MSFWWYKRDKNGKTILWQIDIAIPILMILLCLLLALIAPRQSGMVSFVIWFPFSLLAAGFLFLIISKLSLYRQGIYLSFGSSKMTKKYATLYKAGYILFGLGVLLMLVLFRSMR